MFQNSWSVKLAQVPQHLTIASLPIPSFVYQGQSNQLSVFANNETQNLPIRKQILSLSTINKQHLLILTKYNLSCFDLLNNEERFSLQFENSQKLYVINNKIYVVSGSSLFCYDSNGEQLYVNHLSANITAIAKVDSSVSNSQIDQIVIATSEMRMFRYSNLNIVFDYAKIVGNATSLCWIGKGIMVGTDQGPIAFYESKKYKWKAKSIHSVFKILRFQQISQYNQNSEFQKKKDDQIIVVRKDGNLQIRDWQNGSTISKIKTGENIIDTLVDDYRHEGFNQIICVLETGNIKAFSLKTDSINSQIDSKNATAQETIQKGNQIQNLNKLKQQLLYNIGQLKASIQQNPSELVSQQQASGDILAPDFKMIASLDYKQGLILQIKAQNGYISGLTFEEPIMPVLTQKIKALKYKFNDSTQSSGQIICEVLVHSSISATKYEVRKLPIYLPKFWKWGLDSNIRNQIQGSLRFKLVQRNARYIMWLKQCFLLNFSQKQEQRLECLNEMKFRFFNWYDKKQMQIVFNQGKAQVQINSDSLKAMGQIFQDLINFIGVKHLNSDLKFPSQKQKIKQLISVVQRLSQTKVAMSGDMADSINTIKFLLVKGESARVVGSMNSFRKTYGQIMECNRNLITQIEKKNVNTKTLTETLKSVNNFINQIANVRYGQPKNQVIAKCRQAIKTKRFPQIYSIMDKGADYV